LANFTVASRVGCPNPLVRVVCRDKPLPGSTHHWNSMMSNIHPVVRAGVLALGLLTLFPAQADEEPQGSQWGLGLVTLYDRKPYRSFDNKAKALPFILYESRWVSLIGPTLDLKLPSTDSLSFSLRLHYAGDGYEPGDSPYLAGMAERKASFWVGGASSLETDLATLSVELLGDASGKSKGKRASLGIEREFKAGDFDFTPRLALHHFDGKYVDYYYGVRANESTSTRRYYAGQATTNVEAGVRIGYSLAPRHKLSLDLNTTRLGARIKDSPLVERSRQDGVRFGYLYLF
jgi:outer membrane protein